MVAVQEQHSISRRGILNILPRALRDHTSPSPTVDQGLTDPSTETVPAGTPTEEIIIVIDPRDIEIARLQSQIEAKDWEINNLSRERDRVNATESAANGELVGIKAMLIKSEQTRTTSRRAVFKFAAGGLGAAAAAIIAYGYEGAKPRPIKSNSLLSNTPTIETPTPTNPSEVESMPMTTSEQEIPELGGFKFDIAGWNILLEENNLLALKSRNPDSEIRVSIQHSTGYPSEKEKRGGVIDVDPSPEILITENGITHNSQVKIFESKDGARKYALPGLDIDTTSLEITINTQDNSNTLLRDVALHSEASYPESDTTTNGNEFAVHSEMPMDPFIVAEIYGNGRLYNDVLDHGIWKILITSDEYPPKLRVHTRSTKELHILTVPASYFESADHNTLQQPGFLYLTAQVMDLVTNPEYTNYFMIEEKLRILNEQFKSIKQQGSHEPGINGFIHILPDYISGFLATYNGYTLPDAPAFYKANEIVHFYKDANTALREVIPLIKHNPNVVRDSLANIQNPNDKDKAVSLISACLDVFLKVKGSVEFEKLFPESRILFEEIGYNSAER